MKSKTTPLPWSIGMRGGANANFIYARDGKDQANLPAAFSDSSICLIYGIPQGCRAEALDEVAQESERFAEGVANAQLIVKAVNSHAMLVEALEIADAALNSAVRHLLGTGPMPDPTTMAHATSAVAKAHKAIRSASATTRAPTRSEVHLHADHGKD